MFHRSFQPPPRHLLFPASLCCDSATIVGVGCRTLSLSIHSGSLEPRLSAARTCRTADVGSVRPSPSPSGLTQASPRRLPSRRAEGLPRASSGPSPLNRQRAVTKVEKPSRRRTRRRRCTDQTGARDAAPWMGLPRRRRRPASPSSSLPDRRPSPSPTGFDPIP